MKAYAIATETIKDQAMFDTYRKEVPTTFVPFGGQFVRTRREPDRIRRRMALNEQNAQGAIAALRYQCLARSASH
jgi:uncharacterized protein (DUF1330 family)